MGIRERWINLLHRAATGTRTVRTLLTPVGVLVFGGFTALFVVGGLVVDRLLHLPALLPATARLPVSLPVLVVGALLTLWSAFHFLRTRGTPVPLNPPPRVVSSGPYRFVRNPMLTGVFLVLLGCGLAFASVSLVFFFVPLYIVMNVWELRSIEEPELIRRLGAEYLEYHQRTPMFVPRFRPGSGPREKSVRNR